jgi:zinc protease
MGEHDDYALDVLAHDLGNSKNSRLYKRLVLKDEVVTEVSVMNETRQDPGALLVLCELREGASPARVEAAVREEIGKQIAEGVDKRDLHRIRSQIRASFLFQDEAALDLAMKLSRFEAGTPNGYRTLETVLPTYDSLTRKQLRQVAAKYFDFNRAAVVWSLPAAGANASTAQSPAARIAAKTKKADKGRKAGKRA